VLTAAKLPHESAAPTERSAEPVRENILEREAIDLTLGAVDEVSSPSPSAPAVAGALQGATLEGTGGAQCSDAAEEVTRAGAATDPADKLFHLRRALRLCPDNADYHNRLGEIYLGLGRSTDAEYEFREALRLDPGLSSATTNLKTLGKN
jgi:predicted Zn-dependent protease